MIFYTIVSSLESEIIKQYYQYEHVKYLNIFHCFNRRGNKLIQLHLSNNKLFIISDKIDFLRNYTTDFTIRSFNMNESLNITKDDIYLKRNIKLGIWMDAINCPYTDAINQVIILLFIKYL